MTNRIRFALLLLAVLVCGAAAGRGRRPRPVSTSLTGTPRRDRAGPIVRFARRYLGVPYAYGGTSPASGFDCSGFTRFVYAHFGIALPHYSGGQFDLGRRVSRAAASPR